MKIALLLCLFVGTVFGTFSCVNQTAGTLCTTCTDTAASQCGSTYYFAGLQNAVSCAKITSYNLTSNPCSLSAGNSICLGQANVNTVDATSYGTTYQQCLNNTGFFANYNPSCCAGISCPDSCTTVTTNINYSFTAPNPTGNILPCYSTCTACPPGGAGFTATYCNAHCGSAAGAFVQCQNNNTCCAVGGSGSALTSFLSYFF